MRIFITGGTGYIGLEVARAAVAAGHEVRALVRATSYREPLEGLGARCFEGDVTDRSSMHEGMSGSDCVVHAAADLEFGGPPDRMQAVNVEGSENVASLAFELGVGHLLAISSIAAFGGSPADGTAATETSAPIKPLPSLYALTKRAGEQTIERWAERGLRVTTVYPSLVYGPPAKRAGANGLLRAIALGRMPALVGADRVTSWIHVADVVEAIGRLIERGPIAGPQRFLLTGDSVVTGDLVREVARLAAVKPPRWDLPLVLARLAARISSPYFRLRGRRSPLMTEYLESLSRHWNFDDSKARAALGWSPRPLSDGLPDAVTFLTRSSDTHSGPFAAR